MIEPDGMEKGGKKPEHRQVMERFNLAWEADRDNRDDALSDLKFVAGDQWPRTFAGSVKLKAVRASRSIVCRSSSVR